MESKKILPINSISALSTGQTAVESEKAAAHVPTEAFRLLDLPPELIDQVMRKMPSSGLGRLERVCKLTQAMAQRVYKHTVGPRPWQREVIEDDYRSLAVAQAQLQQELQWDDEPSWSAEKVMSQLTGDAYLTPEDDLIDTAELALYYLQASPERDSPAWIEAVATALMAQGRTTEAAPYYARLKFGEQPLPARTLLTAARFDWPFDYELPTDVPQDILNLAFVGAAAGGSVEMLRKLRSQGVSLDARANDSTAATTAASYGYVDVLVFLQEQGYDLLVPRPYLFQQQQVFDETPLYYATAEREVAAIAYLLHLGARPGEVAANLTGRSPYIVALQGGHITALRMFLQRQPELAKARLPSGDLQMASAFKDNFDWTQREDLLRFLVEEVGLDTKATDSKKNAAVHFAARAGSIGSMQILLQAGADAAQLDADGNSAFDIAVQNNHDDLVAWLAGRVPDIAESARPKRLELASVLLSSQRERLLRMLAENHGTNFFGNTVAEKSVALAARWAFLKMDERLVALWSRTFSVACLRDYKDNVIGSELDETLRLWKETAVRTLMRDAARAHDTEIDRTHFESVEVIARALSPAVADNPWAVERIAQRALEQISFEKIQTLHDYVTSPQGFAFCAGLSASWAEEVRLWNNLCYPRT